MQSGQPSLKLVESFVVVGRELSITIAADRLGLTVSAVSRRIGDLEVFLGTDLFRRLHRRIELTEAGRRYLDEVGPAVDLIRNSTDSIRRNRARKHIRISTLPVLASSWLLPGLMRFGQQRPDLEIDVQTGSQLIEFAESDVDASIRFGRGEWPGLVSEHLMAVAFEPVCAPSLVPTGIPLSVELLDRFIFLDLDVPLPLWAEWFKGIGLPGYSPRRRKVFDNGQLVYEAAAAGLGIALGSRPIVAPYLESGRLRPAFDRPPVSSEFAYHLVYRERDRDWAPLRSLRSLLKEMAGESASA